MLYFLRNIFFLLGLLAVVSTQYLNTGFVPVGYGANLFGGSYGGTGLGNPGDGVDPATGKLPGGRVGK
ncbi:uncharacterized protein CELE_F15E6.10 [Caenorhabditis elegans]|uniref:Uncharacterized protein n=1 Tax=Caenorhabditis elegans TaxID=6239 RepID=Q4R130_CAEEL|nr:Uncharacterized protein CELE_F15E6.10 [Caenorhabditis elegans]CCD69518.1 Uncharacterized protein CELE_F15E6.10 [Caenorhabditis elegans]|eukprot:NP_001033408.1 Uncharacterized protein CELE_F15E6.10 [Caenorhabditis elegans]